MPIRKNVTPHYRSLCILKSRDIGKLFLVFTHAMRRPCRCAKQWQNVAQVLHNYRIKFPKDCFRYCSVHQHGRRDVT